MITIQTPKGKRSIGPGQPSFIVAEMSGNHNHSLERALKIIDAAAAAGVDAIKLQTYTPDTLTIDSADKIFQVNVNKSWSGKTLYELYKWAYTPWDWFPKLKQHAEAAGLFFFSSPFDLTAVDFLESLNIKMYKAASFVTTHIPLLERIGQTGKPVIMSRGFTSLDDLQEAISTLKHAGTKELALLHCVSAYPSTPEQMNLNTIPDLEKRFRTVVGLSDHTLSNVVPIVATALGGSIIEKHLTLNRGDGGPDAEFSLEPQEMKLLVKSVREAEKTLGKANYLPNPQEEESRIFQLSIIVVKEIPKGGAFTEENIRIIRPGFGLKPKFYKEILGKHSSQALKRGTPLQQDHIA